MTSPQPLRAGAASALAAAVSMSVVLTDAAGRAERLAAFRETDRLAVACMPYEFTLNRVSLDMTQAQRVGYRRTLFWNDGWQHVDIDTSLLPTH